MVEAVVENGAVGRCAGRILTLFMLCIGLIGLAGCASTQLPTMTVADANIELSRTYALVPGDKLRITVFDEPNLSGEYQVGSGGEVNLPLIDAFEAAGRTPQQLANDLEAKLLEGGYVLVPRVSVEVTSYRPIYVLGEVNNPGEYEHTGDLTFLQAVAKAGGYTPRAKHGTVILQRTGWETGRRIHLTVNPLMIAPGDTIIIEESFL